MKAIDQQARKSYKINLTDVKTKKWHRCEIKSLKWRELFQIPFTNLKPTPNSFLSWLIYNAQMQMLQLTGQLRTNSKLNTFERYYGYSIASELNALYHNVTNTEKHF